MASAGAPTPTAWDDAPCSLLTVDAEGTVVAVNHRFCTLTGHRSDELVGQTEWSRLLSVASRMLFETQMMPVLALSGAISEVMVDVLHVDGTRIPALMFATRTAAGGNASLQVALMPVPGRREYEKDLRAAQLAAEQATAVSTAARERLQVVANANTALASSLDVGTAVERLAQVLVQSMADWCLVYLLDPDDPQQILSSFAAHADPAGQAAVTRLAELLAVHSGPDSALRATVRGGGAVLLAEVTAEHLAASTTSAPAQALYAELELASAVVAPSVVRGRRVAVFVLARGRARTRFTEDDRTALIDLAARTGIVLDNLRHYEREHLISTVLQQALLTEPPEAAGLEIRTRYLPAVLDAEVGGDWYDAFRLADGAIAVAIGDVAGHDLSASAAMGQLRGVIRTIGHTGDGGPADILRRADRAARGLEVDVVASALVARLDRLDPPDAPGAWTMTWSNAGHPPPFVVRAGGAVELLQRRADLLLGVALERSRGDHQVALGPEDVVFLYTDGLIETREHGIDHGIGRLGDALARHRQPTLGARVDGVIEELVGAQPLDDVVVLAIRVTAG